MPECERWEDCVEKAKPSSANLCAAERCSRAESAVAAVEREFCDELLVQVCQLVFMSLPHYVNCTRSESMNAAWVYVE